VQELFRVLAATAPAGTPAGHISTRQLGALLESLDVFLDDLQLQQSVVQLDPAGRGFIPLPDFISWMAG